MIDLERMAKMLRELDRKTTSKEQIIYDLLSENYDLDVLVRRLTIVLTIVSFMLAITSIFQILNYI